MAMSSGTEAEQRLVAYVRRKFGEHLTAFLLSGWGEQKVVRRRIFVVKPQDNGEPEEVRINIVSDGPEGLPQGQHPLVLLALLRLWLTWHSETSGLVAYRYEEIYGALGWAGSKKSQGLVDEAVERYFGLNYEPVRDSDAGNSESGLADSPRHRLVSGYRAMDEYVCGCNTSRHIYREVCFNVDLLKGLKSKSLFGIDWRQIRTLED